MLRHVQDNHEAWSTIKMGNTSTSLPPPPPQTISESLREVPEQLCNKAAAIIFQPRKHWKAIN